LSGIGGSVDSGRHASHIASQTKSDNIEVEVKVVIAVADAEHPVMVWQTADSQPVVVPPLDWVTELHTCVRKGAAVEVQEVEDEDEDSGVDEEGELLVGLPEADGLSEPGGPPLPGGVSEPSELPWPGGLPEPSESLLPGKVDGAYHSSQL
jgi:hypothetical protein